MKKQVQRHLLGAVTLSGKMHGPNPHYLLSPLFFLSTPPPPPPPPPPMPTTDGSHSAEELAALGLLTFTASSGEASRTYSKGSEASSTGKAEAHMGSAETSTLSLQQSLVPLGPGLPALPKKLVDRIRGQEYIDFAELPPAKGKNRPPEKIDHLHRQPRGRLWSCRQQIWPQPAEQSRTWPHGYSALGYMWPWWLSVSQSECQI